MDNYSTEAWHDLFVMTGGAAAALAGLIFVAVSLNHEQILSNSGLPLIAARTLGVLVALVIVCVLGLTPVASERTYGVELLVLGGALTLAVVVSTVRSNAGAFLEQLDDWFVGAIATLPLLAAGISLVAGSGGGLYWVTAEIITALIAATYYSWILLIEIRR